MQKLLDDDYLKLEVIRLQNDGLNYSQIGTRVAISRTAVSKFLNKESYTDWWAKNEKPIAAGTLNDHHHKMKVFNGVTKFIITSAQNSTFVHKNFLRSLEVMAIRHNARIIVGTFSYNTEGFQNLGKGDGEWFDPLIKDYIIDEPVQLAKDLVWCGELNILPTAVNPLSGFHSYTKSASGIIPHAKVQLESLPTHMSEPARMLYTTGAVTQRNYIEKKAGQKASFHHVFGALFVEIDSDGNWFVRQLIADKQTGAFYDLDDFYCPEGHLGGCDVAAINWGDIHAEKLDKVVASASWGHADGSMLDVLRPRYQFVHDVLDFEARNHHTINDPYVRFLHHVNGKESVRQNVQQVVQVLHEMSRHFCKTIVVESNHDLALQKWLKTSDYRTDPANALFFLELQHASYLAMSNGDKDFSVFEHAVNSISKISNIRFLRTDESFIICGEDGIECGNHGHLGNNGSRGGVNTYQRIGSRVNIGHSHSANIRDGVYQAGVSGKLSMGYNQGGSSWSQSHIVTYPNGKRAIITLKNGKWRA